MDWQKWAAIAQLIYFVGLSFAYLRKNISRVREIKSNLIIIILLLVGFAISSITLYYTFNEPVNKTVFQKFDESKKFVSVRNKSFVNETVPLDGYSYHNCKFTNVKLLYNGTAYYELADNTFEGSIVFATDNKQILGMMLLIRNLLKAADIADIELIE